MTDNPERAPPPFLNIPTGTKVLAGLIVFVFFVEQFMSASGKLRFFNTFGFVPSDFADPASGLLSFFTPVTYVFLHATIMHVIMNTIMLVAFGSGVEKWLGTRRFLILFFGCGIIAALVHFFVALIGAGIFSSSSMAQTVIGASGATSGLFAAGIVYLNKIGTGIGSGEHGYWPLIILWVAVSIIFGLTGSPDGESVAWIAHIGGFLAGFGFLKIMKLM
jgi:membrane associated rhomboid family serine protease